MAYRNTGYERSLMLTVTRSENGVPSGPSTPYNGCLSFPGYEAIDATSLQQLSLAEYAQRLEDFIAYVEAQVPGLNVASCIDPATPPRRENTTSCPIV